MHPTTAPHSSRLVRLLQEHPDITAMSDEEVRKWREKHEIVVTGKDIPKPVTSFATSPFPGKKMHGQGNGGRLD